MNTSDAVRSRALVVDSPREELQRPRVLEDNPLLKSRNKARSLLNISPTILLAPYIRILTTPGECFQNIRNTNKRRKTSPQTGNQAGRGSKNLLKWVVERVLFSQVNPYWKE
mmetsp:Transcript_26608/g.37730  ORF Transcript_26608/g.37730 Transcript_26608/m.37730 type:complete len:112 (-) Transcript_26608:99-434(-)